MDDILEYDNEDVDWIDTQLDTPDTVPLIEQAMGRADDWLSAATLFDAFTGTSRAAERRAFAEQFSLVARPGAPLSTPLHAGDLVVRRALGEGMAGHIALVAEPTLRTAAEATAAGLTPESMRAGRYIQVVEGGIRPHNHADGYARRLLDADGRLPHDTLVLCPHMLRASAIPSGDATAITSNGYEVDIESSTAVFTVRNRLVRWDRVRNCTIQLTALSGAATAQGVANNNGVARISLDTLPDGDYRLQVTPLAAETHPAGVAVGPALLNTGTPPDRLWRLLDATVTVRDGRVRSASSSDVTVAGNRVTVGLQPTWMRSPNTGLRPAGVTTNLIIVHHTGGSRASSALNTFLQTAPRRVSAHYVIDTDGQIIKMVQDSQRVNHAGSAYWNGATNINNTSISIEIVHRSGPYPEEQYRTLIGLLNQLVRDLNIPRANIVGHSDIGLCTPSSSSANCGSTVRRLGRKSSDPGETFDWTRLEAVMLGKMIVAGPVNNTVYGGFFLAAPNGHLRRGDNDADKRYNGRIRPTLPGGTIRYLQQELRRIGYYCPLTAVYDEATEWAVRMYQEHFVNPLSGRRGPNFRLGQVDADTALLIVLTG